MAGVRKVDASFGKSGESFKPSGSREALACGQEIICAVCQAKQKLPLRPLLLLHPRSWVIKRAGNGLVHLSPLNDSPAAEWNLHALNAFVKSARRHAIDADRARVCGGWWAVSAVKRAFTAVTCNPRVAAEAHAASRYRNKRESPSERMIECHRGHWTDRRRRDREWRWFQKYVWVSLMKPVKNTTSSYFTLKTQKTLILHKGNEALLLAVDISGLVCFMKVP